MAEEAVKQLVKPECIEWNELGECVKWRKTAEGKLVADFKGCKFDSEKKGKIVDEFMSRVRRGVEIKE